jgi:hypothetical protein
LPTPDLKKFAGTGCSTILITRRPIFDAEKRAPLAAELALFDGADFNTTHIAAERPEGICRISQRSIDHRDDDGGEPPEDNGSHQWLPPHSRHFAQFLPCKVHITATPKR